MPFKMSHLPKTILRILTFLGLLLIFTESKQLKPSEIFVNLTPVLKKAAADIPVPFIATAVQLWDYFENSFQAFEETPDPIKGLSKKLDILSRRTDDIETTIHETKKDIKNYIDEKIDLNEYFKRKKIFNNSVRDIFNAYDEYLRRVQRGEIASNLTRIALIQNILNGHPDLDSKVNDMHRSLYPFPPDDDDLEDEEEDSLLGYLIYRTPHLPLMCRINKSIQQIVYEIYRKLVEAEIKAFGLKLYLTSLRDAAEPELNTTAQADAATTFFRHMAIANEKFKSALENSPRELRKCNPKNNIEGKSYVKFGPIFQKYIMGEHESARYWPDEKNQPDPLNTVYHICNRLDKLQNAYDYSKNEFACRSRIRNCERYKEGSFTICPLNKTMSYKRYQYVKAREQKFSGTDIYKVKPFDDDDKTNCSKSKMTPWGEIHLKKLEQPLRSIDCLYNLCTCDDQDKKHLRYFDTRWVRADEDMVVTGVRLQPKNNTFYLQIQQGKLLQNGVIKNATWKSLDYNINIHKEPPFKFQYYRYNKIFLENSDDPKKNQIVTGVRFAVIKDVEGGYGIRLDTLLKPFNLATGSLLASNSTSWMDQNSIEFPRKRVNIDNLDMPDDPKYDNNDDLEGGPAIIKLTQTDLDYDFGQNILPFIDIQEVKTFPATPLSGVGLFRRASKKGSGSSRGSGGYVALKLLTFDFAPVIKPIDLAWVKEKL